MPTATKTHERREPSSAVMRSVLFTLGSWGAALGGLQGSGVLVAGGVVGIVVGPATGYWYGTDQIGGVGLVARATGFLGVAKGIGLIDESDIDCLGATPEQCHQWEAKAERKERRGRTYIYGGLGLIAASTIYDFVNVYYQTESWNHRHGVDVAPMVRASGDNVTAGLALTGRW